MFYCTYMHIFQNTMYTYLYVCICVQLLEDGSSKVTWLSSELEEFISVVTILISGDFVPRVQSIQDIQQQVKDTVLLWEKGRESDAFNVEGKGDSVAIENLIKRHR